jgi:hypothetical protein
MQITIHDDTRLVLHQGPWGLRAFGAMFAALGSVVLWYITHGHLGEHNAWVAAVVGGMFALAGLAMAVLAGDVLCTFDRGAHTATIQHRRLIQPGSETYNWSDISDAALEKSMMQTNQNSAPTPVYRPVFLMTNGTRVPWTTISTGDLKRQGNCVAAVRAFTGWHALADGPRAADTAAIQRAAAGVRVARMLMFPFLAIFIVVGASMYISQVKRYVSWQPVRARIVSMDIASSSGDNGTVYRPVISYAYQRGSETVIATGTTIMNISSSYSWADKIRQRYRAGDSVTAYINPVSPSEGYLTRELSWFPLVFVVGPLVMGLIVAFAGKNGQQGLTLIAADHVPILDAGATTVSAGMSAQPTALAAG